jgi:hypothetical protein
VYTYCFRLGYRSDLEQCVRTYRPARANVTNAIPLIENDLAALNNRDLYAWYILAAKGSCGNVGRG